jgi:ribosomal protein S16
MTLVYMFGNGNKYLSIYLITQYIGLYNNILAVRQSINSWRLQAININQSVSAGFTPTSNVDNYISRQTFKYTCFVPVIMDQKPNFF